MTINESAHVKPFLARFQVEIPEQDADSRIVYDESRMILLLDGQPAIHQPAVTFPSWTKRTFVERETTDDD